MKQPIDDIVLFAQLWQAGSFTQAAQQLGCSKSHLSKRLMQLEQWLGSPLLYRTTRKLNLTTAGAALLPEAIALQQQVERLKYKVSALDVAEQGTVKISLPVSLGEQFFGAILADFQQNYPQICLDIDFSNQQKALLAEQFDLALRMGEQHPDYFHASKLFTMTEITCASPGYLAQYGQPVTPEQLSEHNCLLHQQDQASALWHYRQPQQTLRIAVKGSLICNHYSLLKQAALAGIGIARLPNYAISHELTTGQLMPLFSDYQTVQIACYLLANPPHRLAKRCQIVVHYLQRYFSNNLTYRDLLANE